MADKEKSPYEDDDGWYVRPSDEQLKKNDEYWAKKFHFNYEEYISKFKKFENVSIFYTGRQFSIFMKHAKVNGYFVIDLIDESKKSVIAQLGVDLYIHVPSTKMDNASQIAIVSKGCYLDVDRSVNVPELIEMVIEVGIISKAKHVVEKPNDSEFSQFWICDVLRFPEAKL